MSSEIRTNRLASRAGLSTVRLTDTGPVFSGIATFTDTERFDVNNLNAIGIVTASSFSGDGSALTGIQQGVPGISTTGTSTFNSLNVTGFSTFSSNLTVTGVGTFGGQFNYFGPKVGSSPTDDHGISLIYNTMIGALTFHDQTGDGYIRSYSELFFLVDADQSTGYMGGGYGLRITQGFSDTPAGSLIPYTMNHGLPHLGRSAARFGTVFSEQGNFSGVVTATSYVGDGSNLTGIDPQPAGSNTQIQYNNNGAFGASSSLTFDGSMLEVAGIVSATSSPSGTEGLRKIYASTSSPSGGADGDLWLKYDTSPVTSYLPLTGGTATGNIVIQNASLQITNTNATAGNYLEMKTNADSSVSLDKVGDGAFNIGGHNIYLKHDTSNQYYAGFEYNGKSFLNHSGNQKLETTSYGVLVSGEVRDSLGDLRSVPQTTTSSNLVITTSHANKHILHSGTGGWTINTSTGFAIGDMVTFINNTASDQTLFQASGVTLYDTADGATGDHSIKARGMATAICTASNVYYISGSIA